jgi:hypothetical protein
MTVAPVLEPSTVAPTNIAPVDADRSARISFRQPVSPSGAIDAAWWPRSADLSRELPELLDVLWTAGREIVHVTYHITAWQPAPRRMTVEGRSVRLGGFDTSDPLTVRLTDSAGRERIDVLVVPPETDPVVADRALRLAGVAESALTASEILLRAATPTATGTGNVR